MSFLTLKNMCSITDDKASLESIVFLAAILDLSVIKLCYITYLKCLQNTPPPPSADGLTF